jgi:hypothetical protein
VSYDPTVVAERVGRVGPEEVGRRYLSVEPEDDDYWWINEAVHFGLGLDDGTHLATVLGALLAAGEDEDALWRIGDGPVEEGLLPRSGMSKRLIEMRSTVPAVAALWVVMRRYHREVLNAADSYWEH